MLFKLNQPGFFIVAMIPLLLPGIGISNNIKPFRAHFI